jgi:predicted DNA-binding transcriptional regulator AlpA
MESYEFTLRFALPSSETDSSDYEDRLFEAGCDDALLGIGHPGRISLDFIREARDAKTAILGAIADVRSAIPEAVLIEATPDLVGITDVAKLVGSSRQNIRQLMMACKTATPSPVHEGNPSIWHLADILAWLRDDKGYSIPECLFEVAQVGLQVNLAAEDRRADGREQDEIRALFA